MPNASNSPEPIRNIQVWPLVTTSLKRTWAARDDFLRLGIVPVILIFIVTWPAHDLMVGIYRTLEAGKEAFLQAFTDAAPHLLFFSLCSTAATCLFAVNWLRLMTLGPAAAPSLGLNVSGRHLRFFIFMVAIAVVATLVATLVAMLLLGFAASGIMTAFTLGMILWLGIIVRFSPRWIGIAIDAPMPLSMAWKRTRSQGFKLFVALLLIEIPVFMAEQFIGVTFQATGLIDVAPLAFIFVICTIELIRVALQLGALLAAYPQFVRETV